jgi:chromosome segregation ATPase
LAADGKNLTVDSVREALGSTGSKSTIAPFLKRWKVEHQEMAVGAELGIPDELLQAVKGVYEQLQAKVQAQLEQAQAAHDTALQMATSEIEQYKKNNQVLSAANAKLSAELVQTQETWARLQAQHRQLILALATAQSDNAGLQQRLADRSAEITALNTQLTQSRHQFERYQDATAAQRTQERQAAEDRIGRLERDFRETQQSLLTQQATVAKQETQITHLQQVQDRLQETAAIAQADLVKVGKERDQLLFQMNELSTIRQHLSEKLEAGQQSLIATHMTQAAQEKQIELLMQRLVGNEARAEKLDHERITLVRECAALHAQLINYKDNKTVSDRGTPPC